MKSNKRKYPKLEAGEAVRLDLDKDVVRFACCDCANVHTFELRHIKGHIWDFTISPERRRTGQLRRHNFGYLQQDGRLKTKPRRV